MLSSKERRRRIESCYTEEREEGMKKCDERNAETGGEREKLEKRDRSGYSR